MSLHPYYPSGNFFFDLSAGTINENEYYTLPSGLMQHQQDGYESAKPLRKRRDDMNVLVSKLFDATLVRRPGQHEIVRVGGRKNKNEILGLTNARLVKEIHLNGDKYSRDVELVRGISMNANHGDFVLVLRTDGRIVAMSDEVEHHLGKTMRSLYTQCMNIYECLDTNDRENLKSILGCSNDLAHQEHQLVCTFRLPKGKRPSRTREDVKALSMAGHFYSCHGSSYERLFVARCQALVSCTNNETSSSEATTTPVHHTMLRLTLNDDMTISMVSSNTKELLGYTRNDLIGNWFGRYLATDDLDKFESLRQKHLQAEQAVPKSICEILDVYGNNGENRLTFLCQIRPMRERRAKTIKYSIVAQLIDPSMRDEYMRYVHGESESTPAVHVKVEQVNLVSPAVPKTSEDTIMANSPSLSMGLLMFDNLTSAHDVCHHHHHQQQQQPSPFSRTLSNVVAPFMFDDESLQIFAHEYDACAVVSNNNNNNTNMSYWPNKTLDDVYFKCQLEQELASIDALINDF